MSLSRIQAHFKQQAREQEMRARGPEGDTALFAALDSVKTTLLITSQFTQTPDFKEPLRGMYLMRLWPFGPPAPLPHATYSYTIGGPRLMVRST